MRGVVFKLITLNLQVNFLLNCNEISQLRKFLFMSYLSVNCNIGDVLCCLPIVCKL
jgi:hypothetical protein